MGQRNNSKRNATLDEHKERAAGRQQNRPAVDAIRTWRGPEKDRKATSGAFGRGGKANRAAGATGEALDVGRSTRRTRKKAGR
jgi:hypothetical protein